MVTASRLNSFLALGVLSAFLLAPNFASAEEGFAYFECMIFHGEKQITFVQSTPFHFSYPSEEKKPEKEVQTDDEALEGAWADFQETQKGPTIFQQRVLAERGDAFASRIQAELGLTCPKEDVHGHGPHETKEESQTWMAIMADTAKEFWPTQGMTVAVHEITLP